MKSNKKRKLKKIKSDFIKRLENEANKLKTLKGK